MLGILILLIFAVFAVLMFTRRVPALLALPAMAVLTAAMVGLPFIGILNDVVAAGSATMIRPVPSPWRAKIRKPPVTDLASRDKVSRLLPLQTTRWTPMPPRKMTMRPRMPPPPGEAVAGPGHGCWRTGCTHDDHVDAR